MKAKIRSLQYKKKGFIARKEKAASQGRHKGQIEIVYVEGVRRIRDCKHFCRHWVWNNKGNEDHKDKSLKTAQGLLAVR